MVVCHTSHPSFHEGWVFFDVTGALTSGRHEPPTDKVLHTLKHPQAALSKEDYQQLLPALDEMRIKYQLDPEVVIMVGGDGGGAEVGWEVRVRQVLTL